MEKCFPKKNKTGANYFLFFLWFTIVLPTVGEARHSQEACHSRASGNPESSFYVRMSEINGQKKEFVNISAVLVSKKNAKSSIKKIRQPSAKILKKYSSTSEPFLVEVLAENLGIVWGMVFINKKELLFTEREGNIKKLNIQTGKITAISGAPKVYAKGQGGLLDITLHPQFSNNKKVYISYSKPVGGKQTTVIASGILKGSKVIQLKDIFVASPFVSSSRHFGSRLVFDKKRFFICHCRGSC